MSFRGTGAGRNVQPNGGALAIAPSVFVTVLQEIGRLCDSKVCMSTLLFQFIFVFLFDSEVIPNYSLTGGIQIYCKQWQKYAIFCRGLYFEFFDWSVFIPYRELSLVQTPDLPCSSPRRSEFGCLFS